MLRRILASLSLAALLFGNAQAVPITAQFVVGDFTDLTAPTDPVTGSIVWEAASPYDPIESLTSIDLTIAGHAYTLGEIGFLSPGTTNIVGGTVDGVDWITTRKNDFYLFWDRETLAPIYFAYTTEDHGGVFANNVFRKFVVTGSGTTNESDPGNTALPGSSVPEPSTPALLLLTGALLLLPYGRRVLPSPSAMRR